MAFKLLIELAMIISLSCAL